MAVPRAPQQQQGCADSARAPQGSRPHLRVLWKETLKYLQILHTLVLSTKPQARINLQSPAVSASPCLCILSFYQSHRVRDKRSTQKY